MSDFGIRINGNVELQRESPSHSSDPDFCDCGLPRNFEDIGKKFIPFKWVQIRWLKDCTMQIRTNENEEWKTVFVLKGHNHECNDEPITLKLQGNDYKPT